MAKSPTHAHSRITSPDGRRDAYTVMEVDEGAMQRRPPSTFPRRRLFGLEFVDAADLGPVVTDILAGERFDDGRLPVVVTPNVDYLVRRADAPLPAQRLFERARWCLPDGQPIVWASRLVGRPLAARLAGSSLVAAFWSDPRTEDLGITVVASTPSIGSSIRRSKPNAHVIVAPALNPDEQEIEMYVEQHRDEIVAMSPVLVFVAIGFPKELLVIDALLRGWPDDRALPVFLAVGASFEMLFGVRKRAPQWMQRAGLEWFFRFAQEPRRLFVRYFVRDPAFLLLVAREWRDRERPARRRIGSAR
jgi:N-acetylglucosaminyldiphosphoundecaprenol N-acetyl-beta-D-mannosaminyltransferase